MSRTMSKVMRKRLESAYTSLSKRDRVLLDRAGDCTDSQLVEAVHGFIAIMQDQYSSLLDRFADADSRLDVFDMVNTELGAENPWFFRNVALLTGALVRRLTVDPAAAAAFDAVAALALLCRLSSYSAYLRGDTKDIVQEALVAGFGALVSFALS